MVTILRYGLIYYEVMLVNNHFQQLPTLLIGRGIVGKIVEHIPSLEANNILIIVDNNLRHHSIVKKIKTLLTSQVNRIQVWQVTHVKSNLTKGKSFFIEKGQSQYDTIIGVGKNDLLNYVKLFAQASEINKQSKQQEQAKHNIKLILLPTIVTSGIEVTKQTYTYIDEIQKRTLDTFTVATTIIYDPLLSLQASPFETSSNSLITLAKAIETNFFAPNHQTLSLISIKLLSQHIVRATYHRDDIEAYEALLRSSMLLGLGGEQDAQISLFNCFTIPIIKQVDIAYPIALATMLPYLINMYRQINEAAGVKIVKELGVTFSQTDDVYYYLIARLANLTETLGYPNHLPALGIKRADLLGLTSHAYTLWSMNSPSIAPWSENDFFHIYEKAFAEKNETPFT